MKRSCWLLVVACDQYFKYLALAHSIAFFLLLCICSIMSLSLFSKSDDLPIAIGSDETGDFLSIMDYPLQFGLKDQDDENHSADRASCDECPMAVAFRLVSEDSVAGLGDVQDGAIPRARVEDILSSFLAA